MLGLALLLVAEARFYLRSSCLAASLRNPSIGRKPGVDTLRRGARDRLTTWLRTVNYAVARGAGRGATSAELKPSRRLDPSPQRANPGYFCNFDHHMPCDVGKRVPKLGELAG